MLVTALAGREAAQGADSPGAERARWELAQCRRLQLEALQGQ
jgi:hypothetical protein